ncbi:MAG: glycosyltransferase [Rhizomicrobium sp.]
MRFKGRSLENIRAAVLLASSRPYALCVGTMEGRKNNLGLAMVWQAIQSKIGLRIPRLVFAGQRGWANEEFFSLISRTAKLNGLISLIEGPSDEELAFLYKNCLFTVYPSYYEGWGLPIGESLWFGRPVIASKTSAMPEVGGDAVDYVDPYDLEALEAAVIKMLDPVYRSQRAAAAQAMPKRTWREVAEDIRGILEAKLEGRDNRDLPRDPTNR